MLALGGATLLPYNVAGMVAAKRDSRRVDPAKFVIMSDIHICGELNDNGESKYYPNNPKCFNQQVVDILSMRPLPANVLVFGDVAWDYGLEEDYRYAAELLRQVEEAGIRVTLGMGNHDRRAAFFKVFPQY